MRAIVIARPGGPEVLELRDVQPLEPAAEELLISVKATAVNRLDLLQRLGLYPVPEGSPKEIPGVEFSGIVERSGASASLYKAGDKVFGLVGGGSYAESLVVHERTVMPMPASLSFEEAAAIPEAFITAYDAMVSQSRLVAGETVLISAVGSGVGAAAVQIALAIGARPIGTARNSWKVEAAKGLGLVDGIVVTDGKFSQEVLRLTEGRGVDVVLELAGGNYVAEDLICMASRARMIVVGLVAGARAEIELGQLLRKRLEIKGTVMRARLLDEKIAVIAEFAQKMLPMIAAGKLRAVIDRVFPLAEAAQAHALVGTNENFGKVVLRVGA